MVEPRVKKLIEDAILACDLVVAAILTMPVRERADFEWLETLDAMRVLLKKLQEGMK